MKQIPVCAPVLGTKELKKVADCIKTSWISSRGKYISEFEKLFAKFCQTKYGIATTSGTSALHLALATLGISKGDEVIVPTFTMAATIFAVLYTGAKPVLVDCKPDTFNIDPKRIEEKITKKTKAILIAHLYGHPCSMDMICSIARKHNLYLIEDAAEAHGAEFEGRRVGSFGDISAFSFYANKIITTGEGGMVVTKNKKFAERAAILKDMAFSPKRRFLHLYTGFNYRMTNIQAAIGIAQLERIDDFIKMRRYNALLYNKLLKSVRGIVTPIETKQVKNVYWMYAVLIEQEFGISRDKFKKYLKLKGVETRDFFIPLHRQPFLRKLGFKFKDKEFPVADDISKKGLYLPSGSGLSPRDINYVVDQIKNIKKKVS